MELTNTEKRVLAVLTVGGRVNKQEFNTLCNLDDIHKDARERALDGLRDKEIVPQEALRNAGDVFTDNDGLRQISLDGDRTIYEDPTRNKIHEQIQSLSDG